jgi:hypothetical protein
VEAVVPGCEGARSRSDAFSLPWDLFSFSFSFCVSVTLTLTFSRNDISSGVDMLLRAANEGDEWVKIERT